MCRLQMFTVSCELRFLAELQKLEGWANSIYEAKIKSSEQK